LEDFGVLGFISGKAGSESLLSFDFLTNGRTWRFSCSIKTEEKTWLQSAIYGSNPVFHIEKARISANSQNPCFLIYRQNVGN
jgi:hypothetical protein